MELEAIDAHMSIQHSRYGGRDYSGKEKLGERKKELRSMTDE